MPQNGSALANGLLVGLGGVIGAALSFSIHGSNGHEQEGQASGASQGFRPQAQRPAPTFTDARTLVSAALAEVEPVSRSSLMRQAGAESAKVDVLDALRLARDLASVQDRLDFSRAVFGVWADSDPAAALNHARDNLSAGAIQSECIGIVINKWAAEHPHEAWVWAAQNLSGPLQERALTDLLIGWTRRSPKTASEWLIDSGLTAQPLVSAVARTLAEQDPNGADAWAERLPKGNPRKTAKIVIANEWATRDPPQAAAHFQDEIIADSDGALAITLADVWGTTDPAATADWISKLPASASRDQAAAALATLWAASDISAAIAWSNGIEDAGMRGQIITHIGTTWGAIEPLRALDWLTALPPEQAAEGITGAFYSWAGTAPTELRDWISANPSNPHSDRARLSLGDVLTASDAPAAMDLALEIAAPDGRNEALARFFREWRKTDAAAAVDWLDTRWSTLPADARSRLDRELAREVKPR